MRCARGFTVFELIAALVIITVLLSVVVPGYLTQAAEARAVADEAAVNSVRTALILAFVEHRRQVMPRNQWVRSLEDVAAAMEGGQLPKGITFSAGRIRDQRGNEYAFFAETELAPARILMTATGGS